MAKSKKVLSLALAVVMAISMLSIGAFAAKTTPTATITVSASKTEEIQNGEAVTVTVAATASEDYFVGPTSVPVTYDPALFTVSNVTATNLFGEGTTKVVPNTTEAGKVTVVITPETSGNPTATNLNGANVVLYTFTLTAIADAGSCDVAVVNDQKTTANLAGKLYITSFDSADARTAELTNVGQTLVLDNATVNLSIGSAMQPADLALTEAGAADGVKIDTRITFGGQYAGVVYGFNHKANATFRSNAYLNTSLTATNNGKLEYSRSVGKQGYGTGTVITVKNENDTVSKTYIVVIFGDVNCDGLVNAADMTAFKNYQASPATLTNLAVRMAANCQNVRNATLLYNVNANDFTALKAYVNNYTNKVPQATLAATISGLTSVNSKYA